MKSHFIPLFLALALLMAGCGSSSPDEPKKPQEPERPTPPPVVADKVPILISPALLAADSRVSDAGFQQADKVGLYVVNYEGSAPGTLAATGNHVDNACFTYSGSTWTSASEIYWMDDTTPADFYLYYPYTSTIADVGAMTVGVMTDQHTEAGYRASELLVGSAKRVEPTSGAVDITAHHAMSQMRIILTPGAGFTAETLAAAQIEVKITGTKVKATADLATGALTATGNAQVITPWLSEGEYRALVVPQTVDECALITATVDGRDFTFRSGFTFVGGRRHTFTLRLDKSSSGINVGISPWDDDDVDNGGTAE